MSIVLLILSLMLGYTHAQPASVVGGGPVAAPQPTSVVGGGPV